METNLGEWHPVSVITLPCEKWEKGQQHKKKIKKKKGRKKLVPNVVMFGLNGERISSA